MVAALVSRMLWGWACVVGWVPHYRMALKCLAAPCSCLQNAMQGCCRACAGKHTGPVDDKLLSTSLGTAQIELSLGLSHEAKQVEPNLSCVPLCEILAQ